MSFTTEGGEVNQVRILLYYQEWGRGIQEMNLQSCMIKLVMARDIAMSNITTSSYTRVYVCVAVCW